MTTITKADRDCAEEWRHALIDPMAIDPADDVKIDVDALAEAFARHRLAERALIARLLVKWRIY